ncbi:YiiX/YebB-like N1pC/P60 family cysteine hydrolase [Ralstonia mannitolilytica]|uniref:YiiX/YebB-like N1pC/P60 family cysteine hydrolase n=1 Tax=Ralstonia mannitolilytica TaxID=105219 RepID=UPI000695F9D8|nr:YiiX/YebB-like N1pC/P60 family cysteine hydrolase [Ralstonia mannitolilytica]
MKKIDYTQLQPGDILLTTSLAAESWSIRAGTKSDISHAMLYVSSTSVIDSTGDGVHARNLQKMFYDDKCAIHALRLKGPLTTDQLSKAIAYARAVTGTGYSVIEAVRTLRNPRGRGSDKQFCSRLVARAYAAAGITLVGNPDFCTPEQLKESPFLFLLPSPAASVSDEEYRSLTTQPNGVEGMVRVTNDLLGQVRALSPQIQSINDAFQYLIENPEMDDAVLEALRSSGYLDYWRTELARFPWRYDMDALTVLLEKSQVGAEIREYCEETLAHDAAGSFKHWEINLATARAQADQFQLKSFAAMARLYENLVENHQVRVRVAREWLASRAK